MLDHLVDLELVVASAGLEKEVVGEILDQIARGEHLIAAPGLGVRILDKRSGATGDEMLRVADVLHSAQIPQLAGLAVGRAGQHRVYRGRYELDVSPRRRCSRPGRRTGGRLAGCGS